MTLTVRRLESADLEWAAALLTANSAGQLTPAQRAADGFVQGAFTPEKVAALCGSTGGFVAERVAERGGDRAGDRAGLVLTSAEGQISSGPIGRTDDLARERFGSGSYVLYGPVVVDAAHRRTGVARALLDQARRALADRFAHGVAFVEGVNTVSLQTHRRLGLVEFATFDVDGRTYHAMSFDTQEG